MLTRQFSFHFTQLNPRDPQEKFSFNLAVDKEDKYEITDCSPPLDARFLMEVADVLNKTEDMSFLVRKMRK